MTLFSYVVTHDTGFSPNPFWGYCTLSCCKPSIRRKAREGDWIIGLTPKSSGNRIVFIMQVDEVEGFDMYWQDRRFERKKPQIDGTIVQRCGDNIYKPKRGGGFRQLPSQHSDIRCKSREDAITKERDLSGKQVLISENFAYFGSKAKDLPPDLEPLIVARGHRCRFSDEVLVSFRSFAGIVRLGVYSAPTKWKPDDTSWMRAAEAWLIVP